MSSRPHRAPWLTDKGRLCCLRLLAGLDAERYQGAGHAVGLGVQLGVGPPPRFEDERLAPAPSAGRLVQHAAQRALAVPVAGDGVQASYSCVTSSVKAPSASKMIAIRFGRQHT